MRSALTFFVVASVTLALACPFIWAQATAQISGTVSDQSGAVLPGAEITATQTETGIVRNTVSNETGSYVLPNLPLGSYRLEVSLPGFRKFAQSGIVLQVNSNPVINAVLAVGQQTELIEVQANAALVETRTTGVGQIMETQRILELPLNGRNVTELITLGGAAVNVPLYSSSTRSISGQQAISVAGGLASGVNYALDGAMHTNPYDHLSLPLPFPDALQEFKIETSALSASQGQHSGAQVSAVTKSGTNEFHGSLFEFVRNDLLNATQYFARFDPVKNRKVQSTLKRNQFGGTGGGRIIRNKLFFFGGYQGTTERSDPSNVQAFVPTAAMLQGDFTAAMASPVCGRATPLGGPFSGNRVDPSSFNQVALNILQKLPQSPDPTCGQITYGVPNKTDSFQIVGKTDWQLNAAHQIIGRVLFTGDKQPVPYELAPDNILTTGFNGRKTFAQSYTIGDTWLVSPKTVVSSRLVANYTNVERLGADFSNFGDVGVQNYYSFQPKYLQLVVGTGNPTNGFNLGGAVQNTSTYRTFSTGINSDVSLSRGVHQWAVGGAFEWIDSNSNANVNSSGRFTFSGSRTGSGLADFLLGLPSQFAQSAPNTDYMRKWYTALYIADSWRVRPRWTLNYGVRWEPDLAESLTLGRVATYSEQRRAAGIGSTVFTKAPLGFSFPGDPGFPGKRGRDRDWALFSPRLGFAWDVDGRGRTSVRASVGIGYDYPNAQYHLWTSIIPPFGSSFTLNNPSFTNPFGGPSPFPRAYSPDTAFITNGDYTVLSNIKPAQAQNWNLSIQRQLGNDWLVSASYLGSHTIHILGSEQLNPALFFPGRADASGTCTFQGFTITGVLPTTANPNADCSTVANTNARRRLQLIDFTRTGQYVANLVEVQSGGNANYNGLLIETRKRAAKGITLDANYTWSHCIGPLQGNEAGDTGANPAIPNPFPGNRDRGRGNCLADLRHALNLTSVLETPQFSNKTLRLVASGWRLAPLYRLRSGTYMSITAGSGNDFARNGTNINTQPAQYVGGDPILDHSAQPFPTATGSTTVGVYLNKNAFTNPAVGTFGNVGTRTVAGPHQWDFDIGLSRNFKFKETQRVEFRWEVFNVTNSFRPLNPVSDITNSQFGQIRSARDPRIMQFALKYAF
jgi:Carboxypeptidase regulatory-like domain